MPIGFIPEPAQSISYDKGLVSKIDSKVTPQKQPDMPDRRKEGLQAQAYDREQSRLAEQAAAEAEQERLNASNNVRDVQTTPVVAQAFAGNGDVQASAQAILAARGYGDQFASFSAIISRESGWNPNAYNAGSGACGLPQALPCSKMGGMDVTNQINWALNYMVQRYGGPDAAWSFWQAHNWY